MDELKSVRLLSNISDSWEWRYDSSKLYSVRSGYKLLSISSSSMVDNVHHYYSIWHSRAPLKDRIHSKVALSRRGISFQDNGGLFCSFVMMNQNLLLISSFLARSSTRFGNCYIIEYFGCFASNPSTSLFKSLGHGLG
ncbi:hypothetical protein Lal_00003191 [Lupinus albus]|nr:hypothetical protein Lal_00003191 [Lupinus albus]